MATEDAIHNQLTLLKQRLEQTCQRTMRTPKDFDFLSQSVFEQTRQLVNSSTLKRLYGYVGSVNIPRESTLDILCLYIGYTSWQSFQNDCNGEVKVESDVIVGEHLYNKDLYVGDMLRILWQPDRVVTVRYEGDALFTVVQSENSKLKVGCTFHCTVFVKDEPLYLTEVTGLTEKPVDYVCGQTNGITYTINH